MAAQSGVKPDLRHRSQPIVALRAAGPFVAAIPIIGAWVVWSHFQGAYFSHTWYPSAMSAVLLFAAVAAARGQVLPEGRWARTALGMLGALVGLAFLSMLWADSPGSAWEASSKLLLLLMMAWTLSLLPWTPRAAAVALGAWALGVTAVCAIALLDTLGAASLAEHFIEGRYLKPIGYSNGVSALPVMAFWPALWLSARASTPLALRILFLAAAVFLLQFSLLPQSRGSLIGLAVTLPVFIALVPDRMRMVPPLLITAAATAIAIGPIYDVYTIGIELADDLEAGRKPSVGPLAPVVDEAAGRIGLVVLGAAVAGACVAILQARVQPSPGVARGMRLAVAGVVGLAILIGAGAALANAGRIYDSASDRWQTFKSEDDTTATRGARLTANYPDQRYDYWRVALNLFRDRPVAGVAAGNYEIHYQAERRHSKPSRFTHDIWLRVLAEGGLAAVLLFAGLLAAAGGGLLAGRRRAGETAGGVMAVCFCVTLYFLVHASFDWLDEFPALIGPAVALPFIGLALVAPGDARSSEGRRRPSRGSGIPVLVAALGVATVLGLSWLSVRYLERADSVAFADGPAAYRHLDRASSLNPLAVEPHLAEGTIAITRDEMDRATRAFEKALEVEENWYAYLELALLEAQRGRFAAAKVHIERARALNASDPFVTEARTRIRRGERIEPAEFNRMIREQTRQRFTRPTT